MKTSGAINLFIAFVILCTASIVFICPFLFAQKGTKKGTAIDYTPMAGGS